MQSTNQQQRFVVPTKLLREELLTHAQKLANEANYSGEARNTASKLKGRYEYAGGKGHDDSSLESDTLDGSGWKTLLAARAHVFMPEVKPEAMTRRLYSVLKGEFETTHVHIADVLLLACGVHIEDTDIPTLPWAARAARERVDLHCEDFGDQDMPTRALAARKLLKRAERIVGTKTRRGASGRRFEEAQGTYVTRTFEKAA